MPAPPHPNPDRAEARQNLTARVLRANLDSPAGGCGNNDTMELLAVRIIVVVGLVVMLLKCGYGSDLVETEVAPVRWRSIFPFAIDLPTVESLGTSFALVKKVRLYYSHVTLAGNTQQASILDGSNDGVFHGSSSLSRPHSGHRLRATVSYRYIRLQQRLRRSVWMRTQVQLSSDRLLRLHHIPVGKNSARTGNAQRRLGMFQGLGSR
jgi:hypothetical protein